MTAAVEGRGLADHLRQKGAAMRAAAQRKPAAADWQEDIAAHCTADDVTGVRKLTIQDFHLLGDGGPDIGGFGLGPTSPELLLGVMSTCLTHTILCLAAWEDIALDQVDVDVRATNNDANFFGVGADTPWTPQDIAVDIHLASTTTAADILRDLARRAEEICPIMRLLRSPTPVTVRYVD
jgi:organic hydroperoxide reductase OsmC/OhrA